MALRTLAGASLLWIALSAISDGVTTLVLPVALGTGSSTTEATLGWIGSLGLLVGIATQPLAGIASDRLRPRFGRVVVAGLGVGLTVLALGGVAVARSPVAVAAAFAGLCLALALVQAPQQALAADLVPMSRRGRAAGSKGFADLLGSMLGFAVLGPLLASGDAVPALASLGVLLVTSYGLVVVLVGRADRRTIVSALPIATERDQRRWRLGVTVASRFLFLLGIYAVGRFLVPFISARLGLSVGAAAEVSGGLLSLLALVTAIGSIPAGIASDRFQPGTLLVCGAVAAMAGIAIMAVASDLVLIGVGGVAMAAGTALFVTANWRTLLDLVAGPSAGRLLGFANVGTAGAAAIAGLGGPVISATEGLAPGAGYPTLFVLALGAVALSALVAAPVTTRHRTPDLELGM